MVVAVTVMCVLVFVLLVWVRGRCGCGDSGV